MENRPQRKVPGVGLASIPLSGRDIIVSRINALESMPPAAENVLVRAKLPYSGETRVFEPAPGKRLHYEG